MSRLTLTFHGTSVYHFFVSLFLFICFLCNVYPMHYISFSTHTAHTPSIVSQLLKKIKPNYMSGLLQWNLTIFLWHFINLWLFHEFWSWTWPNNVSFTQISFMLLMLQTIVLTTFRGICEATLCMHSAKPHPLAHRDIKTANVLLKDDFTPILMDLG